jgi:serine/threonine-protein kinase HipA
MAVGDHRHYAVTEIVPRHFMQTAKRAGLGEKLAASAIEELSDHSPAVFGNVIAALPGSFPEQLTESIKAGYEQRLESIARWKGTN